VVVVRKKLLSPAGFLLALLLFALPFVAVSCDAGAAGSFDVSYTGVDLATGTKPSIEASGALAPSGGGPVDPADAPDPGVHVLAILTAALLVVGIGTVLLRRARRRRFAAAGVAVAAGALLISTELTAMAHLRAPAQRVIESQAPGTNDGMAAALDEVIQTRIGFWLVLAVLILIIVLNLAMAARAWVRQ
jgi:hypothetical protein